MLTKRMVSSKIIRKFRYRSAEMHQFKLHLYDDVSLVAPTIQHANEMFEAVDCNRAHLRQFLDWVDMTTSVEDEQKFLKTILSLQAEGKAKLYFIYKANELIGTVDLHQFNEEGRFAEIGYWLVEKYTGQGIMTKVVKAICKIAFQDLALNKVTLRAEADNHASQQVAMKCGFRYVGTMEQHIYRKSKEAYVDLKYYELLKEKLT
ncbi:GNAT family N-acetyltransferase [Staphylococcus felis]|nr:GNAT family N-acetyltransferase [Staphylococcus felis]